MRRRTPSRPSAAARCSPPTRRCRPATTPTPPGRSPRCSPGSRPSSASTPRRSCAAGARIPARPREPFGDHPVRAAGRAAAPTASARRHGEVAARCGTTCGRTAPSPTCRSPTSPTASTSPPGSRGPVEEPARPPPRRGLGWQRAADPATWEAVERSPTTSCGPPAAQRGALIELVRECGTAERLRPRATPPSTSARPRSSIPTCSRSASRAAVATYKRLDLMLRDVDRALALLADTQRPVQLILAGKAHPRDDDGKRTGPAPVRHARPTPEVRRRVVLPRRLRPHARRGDGPRLRRLGQRPPAAARGQRHERDEVRRQRRAATRRARRLVARGLRRHQRLGDRRRGRPRPRGAGLAPRRGAYRPARATRSSRSSTTATTAASRRRGSRWCARRCARSARASAPDAWCATTRSGSTRLRPRRRAGMDPRHDARARPTAGPGDMDRRSCNSSRRRPPP